MIAYSSSTISLLSKHCPAALDKSDAGLPRDDAHVFHAGVAAHAVLEAIGRRATKERRYLDSAEVEDAARGPVERLIETGYTFAGDPQPPLPAEDVYRGRDLALAYEADTPVEPGGQYEIGLGADKDWNPVAYDSPAARWRAVIDRVDLGFVGTEEGGGEGAIVTDYKTSWAADNSELSTIQRRGQIVLTQLHHPEAAVIRAQVVAVRSRKVYATGDGHGAPEDVWVHEPEGRSALARWKADISGLMDIADRQRGKRPHVPGRGCIGCPFYSRCDHGREYWKGWHPQNAAPVLAAEWASAYAAAKAIRTQLEPLADNGYAIQMQGGGEVGWVSKPSTVTAPKVAGEVARAWIGRKQLSADLVAGLVAAIKPTPTQLETVADRMFEDDTKASEWLKSVTKPIQRREWKIMQAEKGDAQ